MKHIAWSPGVTEESHSLMERRRFHNLLPPFLQKKPFMYPDVYTHSKMPRDVTDIDSPRCTSLEGTTDHCVSINEHFTCQIVDDDNLPCGITEKSSLQCVDDCETLNLTCRRSRDRLDGETKSFGEITDSELHDAPEDHDEGYQRWEDDFEGVETDLTRRKRKIELASPCESYSSLSEHEVEPGTTDPYLSHKIYMPYNRILKPRYFASAGRDVEYRASSLPRRPRSPVREILPGRFDLKAAYEERSTRRWATEGSKRLRESKERVSLSLKRLSVDQTDEDDVISSVVLQAVCEEVTLTLMDTKIDTDIHTFVNVAVIWALSELQLFTHDTLIERFTATKDFRAHGAKKELDVVDVLGYGGMRKKLAGVYRPPYSHNVHTTLHVRLPWEYVSPSHERGQTKLYPNVRERIDEKVPKINEEEESSTYVPDITCFHLREVLDKTYVAYKRKSKSLVPLTESSLNLMEDLFLQLVSFL